MQSFPASEKLLVEEITEAAYNLQKAIRGLSIGEQIKLIRTQLGMSQTILARLAGIPQSTISRIEQDQQDPNLSTLQKIFSVISCDLIIAPALQESIEIIRRKQAQKITQKRMGYLKGTMNLEKQQPDDKFIQELIKQEEEELLRGPNAKLWEEE